MKWFKHHVDANLSESLSSLIEDLGFEGYGRYWRLLEFLANQFDGIDDTFRVHRSIVRATLRLRSWNDCDTLVERIANVRGMYVERIGNVYEMKCPILLELLGRDFKKARSGRAQAAPKIKNKIKSKTKIKNKNENKNIKSTQNENLNREIWDAYKSSYEQRYGVEPTRNASINAKISQIGKRLGADAVEVIKFFVRHNESFYIKKAHSVGLCLSDAESLHTQWKTGNSITSTKVKQFESINKTQEMNELIDGMYK